MEVLRVRCLLISWWRFLTSATVLGSCFEIQPQMWTSAVTPCVDCIRLLAGRCMNICHEVWSFSTVMQPHTLYTKHKELLQSWYWELKENATYSAHCAHWNVIFWPLKQRLWVHQFYSKRMQESNFCHDNCKNCAKMRQVHHGAVALCWIIMTPQWNNRASFYIVVTCN